jgi:UDP-N-acetylglucosamine 2-epimerase (non-hydrolysing)
MSMPEEINRILVDEITDLFFVTEQSGVDNLLKEGKPKENIFFVGNTMIDTMVAFEKDIVSKQTLSEIGLKKSEFVLMTIHRPAAVDNPEGLKRLIALLKAMPESLMVVFPLHPRTLNKIKQYNLQKEFDKLKNLKVLEPLDYFSFQNLIHNCKMVLTDSGGIQEETTYKQKPCLTLRPNTERPITIDIGSNTLLDFDVDAILAKVNEIQVGTYKNSEIPEYWDGSSTIRILDILAAN